MLNCAFSRIWRLRPSLERQLTSRRISGHDNIGGAETEEKMNDDTNQKKLAGRPPTPSLCRTRIAFGSDWFRYCRRLHHSCSLVEQGSLSPAAIAPCSRSR